MVAVKQYGIRTEYQPQGKKDHESDNKSEQDQEMHNAQDIKKAKEKKRVAS